MSRAVPSRRAVTALVRMGRPLILPGGILAYGLGTAMGFARSGSFNWSSAAAGLLVTEAANLAASYADEWADVDTDTLARRTWFSGGSGVLPEGLVPAGWALGAAWACAALAVGLEALFIVMGRLPWHTAWILGLGLVGGWFYSMPPLALERRGLGEPLNALIGGVLMPMMGYTAQAGAPDGKALAALAPVFLIVLVNLLGVHWPDRQADQAVGKRSLVVIAGPRIIPLHRSLTGLAYLLAFGMGRTIFPAPAQIAFALTLPLGLWATGTIGSKDSPAPAALAMAGSLLILGVGWGLCP